MENLMFRIEVQGISEEVSQLGRLKNELSGLAEDKKKLDAEYKLGLKTTQQYEKELGKLTMQTSATRQSASALEKSLNAQHLAAKGADGSITRLGYDLVQLKQRYRDLTAEQRNNSAIGGKMHQQISKMDAEYKKLNATMGNHQANVGNYGSALDKLKGAYMGVLGAITGVVIAGRSVINFAKEAIEKANEQERAERKVEAIIRSTGMTAGLTADELKRMAMELQNNSMFGDEQILNEVSAQLLTFTNISKDSFGRTQQAVLDLATVLDGNLLNTSIMLGKALNDPLHGLTALRRVGIAFTEDQVEMVKQMVNSNRLLDAQNLILSELERQYGGTAKAVSEGGVGAAAQFKNAWGDMMEAIASRFIPGISKFYKEMKSVVNVVADWVKVPVSEKLQEERAQINLQVSSITSLNEGSATRKKLMQELINKYPDFFKNLNAEKTTNDELLKVLKNVNDQYVYKIKLAVLGEELGYIEKQGTDNFKEQRTALAAINVLYEQRVENMKADATVQEKIQAIKNSKGQVREVDETKIREAKGYAIQSIEQIEKSYYSLRAKEVMIGKEYNKVLTDQQKIELELKKLAPTPTDEKNKDLKKNLKKNLTERQKAIHENEKYILELKRKYLDMEIGAMLESVEKKRAAEENRWNDEKAKMQEVQSEKLKSIDEEIQAIENKGKKATKAELEQLETLKQQKESSNAEINNLLEIGEKEHQAKMFDIIQKSTLKDLEEYKKTLNGKEKVYAEVENRIVAINKEGEDEITKQYDDGIRRVDEEYSYKKKALAAYYLQKGTLTEGEEKKMALEEKKLAVEVLQKKFDLLAKEIEARRELGTITEAQYNLEMQKLTEMYTQLRTMQSELQGEEEGDKSGGGLNSWVAQLFGINENEAAAIVGQVEQLLNSIVDMYYQSQQRRIQMELKAEQKKLDKEEKAELATLEQKRKKGMITEDQYKAEKEKLDEKYNQKRIAAERKAFEQNKKLQKTMIWINAALAVIKSIAEYGFIIGGIMGALILITAGIQASNVDKQQYPEMGMGGLVKGRSHAQGGEVFATRDDRVELEGGEGVINKRSMASNDIMNMIGTPRQIASGINAYRGWGVPFAVGGYVPASTPTRGMSAFVTNANSEDYLAEKIGKVISDKKVYVVESDITDAQKNAQKIAIEREW